MSLQIRVVVGTDLVFLDLYQNEPVLMNISFSEIQNITSKNSAFSQSFQLPGTKVNNQVFDYYYDISSTPINFNPNNKFPAVMTWNGLEVLEGNMRLESVVIDQDEIIYNVTFYNQIGDLAANIGDKFLNQLDTTSINHPYTPFVIRDSQVDPNLYRLSSGTTYSYQDGRTFWGLYNIGYEYSDTFSGAGYTQYFGNIQGIGPITISAGQKRFKVVYSDPTKQILNIGDYIRLTDSGTSYYVEGTVVVVENEAITFNAEYGLGTGTFSTWSVERILPSGNLINKTNTPLISFSPALYTGSTNDNTASKPGYFDYFDTPVQEYYFKPSIQVKTLYELIVDQAGYKIQSDFFDTSYFQKFYLPLKFEDTIYPKAATPPCYNFSGSDINLVAGPGATYLNIQSGNTCNNIPFSSDTTTLAFPQSYNGVMKWKFNWTMSANTACVIAPFPYVYFLYLNGVTFPGTVIYNNSGVCATENVELIVDIPVPSTELIQFGFVGDQVAIRNFTAELLSAPPLLISGNTFNYANEFPPDQLKQIDFITSINRYFNLVVVPSPDYPEVLIIEPMIDYIGKGQVLDWTSKVDFSSPINVAPTTSIINGTLKYNFMLDNDYVNQQFNIAKNKVFGTYEIQLNQEYKEQKTDFNTMFASPTDYELGYTQAPVLTVPSMFSVKTSAERSQTFFTLNPYRTIPRLIFRGVVLPNFNYRPGVYWYGQAFSFGHYQMLNRFNTYPFSYTNFSHYLNYDASNTYESNESVFPWQQDLYDVYYEDYIRDLVSNENKIVSGKIYLTPWEISQLRFDEKILIQNNYFRINKISNFNMAEPAICDIELVKLTREYDPHPVMYYTLVSCNPLFESLFTNSDIMFNLYAYIGRYVKVYSESGTYYGCFLVTKDVYDPNRTYMKYWITIESEFILNAPIYDDCTCTGETSMIIVQESPTPSPTPTNTPTPSITPTNTPTVTPTPSFTPTPSVTPPTVCLCYWILNETGGALDYEYTPCGSGTPTIVSLGGGASARRCSSTVVTGAGLTITPCSSVTFCSADIDCDSCT
jgi:hypothetical protein